MSQGVVEAAVRQSISEEENQEVLQLLLRRFGPPRKRVSGPFSQQEDKLWARGEIALQVAAREKRELEARRIARRARERAEHCRLVADFSRLSVEEDPEELDARYGRH